MSNQIAVWLDRAGIADMSCIAGVGGDVPALVKVALKANAIIGIDGCPLHCVSACLGRHGLKCDHHFDLSKMEIKREKHRDFNKDDALKIYERIERDLNAKLTRK